MTDQVRISDDGSLEIERTWDGQPLWSAETEQERLFAGDAFQQMPGQLPIEELPPGYHISYPGPRSPFYGQVMLHEPGPVAGCFSLHPDEASARNHAHGLLR